MQTKIFTNETGNAADLIKAGGLIGVPTETVYGLAGNGLDVEAVEKIYEVKGRPSVKPLSLMVPSGNEIKKYTVDAPEQAYTLADKFWPGPLTIVLKAASFIPEIVLAGGSTVGLRCPDSALTLQLLTEAGVPFAAPSANISGQPSPKNAQDVLAYFNGVIDGVIDGGECTLGTESTILDMTRLPYRILRQGALSEEAIQDALVDGMKIVGVTGGTGSGKTTAIHALEDQGACVIDCDAVYHDLLANSTQMLHELWERFPEAFPNGEFCKAELGKAVFQDPDALKDLNSITHKYVIAAVRGILRQHAMNGGKLAAVDAVELISSGMGEICDATFAITADEEVRAGRIMQRDGITREYALMRIRAQKSAEYYQSVCNYTLCNNSTPEEFKENFIKLLKEVL